MLIIPPERGQDDYGFGYYGASRSGRTHNGVDVACYPDSQVLSIDDGIFSKYGYPYGDDLSYRYVEIKNPDGYKLRYFYVELADDLLIGDSIIAGDIIGKVQDLNERYPGITSHIHFEVKKGKNQYFDPADFLTSRLEK